jgi:hypothetical protein
MQVIVGVFHWTRQFPLCTVIDNFLSFDNWSTIQEWMIMISHVNQRTLQKTSQHLITTLCTT